MAVPHPARVTSAALVDRHKLIEFDARFEKIPAALHERIPAEVMGETTYAPRDRACRTGNGPMAAGVRPERAVSVAVAAVILLNAGFAFVQEMQAERTVEALAAFLALLSLATDLGVTSIGAAADRRPGQVPSRRAIGADGTHALSLFACKAGRATLVPKRPRAAPIAFAIGSGFHGSCSSSAVPAQDDLESPGLAGAGEQVVGADELVEAERPRSLRRRLYCYGGS